MVGAEVAEAALRPSRATTCCDISCSLRIQAAHPVLRLQATYRVVQVKVVAAMLLTKLLHVTLFLSIFSCSLNGSYLLCLFTK